MGMLPSIAQLAPRDAAQDKILNRLRGEVSERDRAQIKQSAEDFESLFLNIVLKSMRDTIQKSGLIDGGNAEDIYRSMLDDEYAKMMATQRETGLADNIEAFLLQAQAKIKPAESPGKDTGLKAYQAQGLQESAKQATMDNGADRAVPILSGSRPKAL